MAMYNLAFIYKNGADGVKKDLQRAVMLLSEVEEKKDGV
jgi:TPR repeat protein